MKKYLHFYADDFGYKSEIDNEIIKLYSGEKIASFSVLPDFISAIGDKKTKDFIKNKKVAIHINLIEGKNYNSLAFFVIKLFLGQINFEALKIDMQRQIDVIKKFKPRIIEINSHQHVHALYPLSKIFISLARINKIPKVRSYKNVRAQTLSAKLCLFFLKIASLLSYFRYNGVFGLPETWKLNSNNQYYMSWEDGNFSIEKLPNIETDIIFHPGSEFDKNNSFKKYL